MKLTIAAALILAAALPAAADARDIADTGAAGTSAPAADDSCIFAAAVRASYTAARDEDIYAIARKQCGFGQPGPADADAAAALTRSIAGLRDMRRRQDAMYGLREVAAR